MIFPHLSTASKHGKLLTKQSGVARRGVHRLHLFQTALPGTLPACALLLVCEEETCSPLCAQALYLQGEGVNS